MPDVFPRRNLPGDSDKWGRELETRSEDNATQIGILRQSLQGQNRNTASSLESLANQLRAIEDAQEELEAQQVLIQSQQASIIATQTFLATQTVGDSKSTLDQVTGNPGTITWYGYNPTYDCAVTVTTGSAGRLIIQASATLLSSGLTSILGIEIVGVVGPAYPGPYSTYQSDVSASSSGVARNIVVDLAANSTYTVRTRRGASGSSGTAMWRDQSLVVTRS